MYTPRISLAVMDAISHGVLLIRLDTICYVNQRMASQLGFDVQELLNQSAAILGPRPELFHSIPPPTPAPLSNARTVAVRNRRGDLVPCLESTLHAPDTDEILIVIQEADQNHSMNSFVTGIIENSSLAVIGTDLHGTIRAWNQAATGIFGYKKVDIIGRNISILMPPDLNQSFTNRVIRGETLEKQRVYVWTKIGILSSIEINISPVRDELQMMNGLAYFCRDITLELEAEKQLLYQARLLEAVNDAIVVSELNGNITYWNQGAIRLFGWMPEEVQGKPYADLFDSGFNDIHNHMEEVAPGVWEGQQKVYTAQGNAKYVRVAISLIYSEHQQPDLLVAVFSDITELVESRLQAEEAVRSKSEFLANVSHEIRTPMSGILGFSELLNDEHFSPEQRAYLQAIKQNTGHLLELINDILDLSKVEAQSMIIENKHFSVKTLMDQSIHTFDPVLHDKRINLKVTIGGMPDYLIGDSKRIKQVLNNLLSNAVKFTPPYGRIQVSAEAQCAGMDNQERTDLRIQVVDNGIGIPAEKLGLVFEPFVQVDSSTTRRYGGTGLGLAITKRLVELMGGSIQVESIPGKGSSFIVSIPLKAAVSSPPAEPGSDLSRGIQQKILVITDDENLKLQIHRALFCSHCRPVFVSLQDRISSVLRFHRPISVIVDLPDGPVSAELAEILKDYPNPVILFTDQTTANQGMDNGLITVNRQTGPDELMKKLQDTIPPPCEEMEQQINRVILAVFNSITQQLIHNMLEKLRCEVHIARNPAAVVELLAGPPYRIMIIDMMMLDMNDAELLKAVHKHSPDITVIALRTDPSHTLPGIDVYLDKPLTTQSVLATVNKYRYN